MRITFLISNLHCSSCVTVIHTLLAHRIQSGTIASKPEISLLDRSVKINLLEGNPTKAEIRAQELAQVLRDDGGFDVEIHGIPHVEREAGQDSSHHHLSFIPPFLRHTFVSRLLSPMTNDETARKDVELGSITRDSSLLSERHRRHIENCQACSEEIGKQRADRVENDLSPFIVGNAVNGSGDETSVNIGSNDVKDMDRDGKAERMKETIDVVVQPKKIEREIVETTIVIEGMTCAACSTSISNALNSFMPSGRIISNSIDLLSATGIITYDRKAISVEQVLECVEDVGYGVEEVGTRVVEGQGSSKVGSGDKNEKDKIRNPTDQRTTRWTQITFFISGMTCAACSSSITRLISTEFSNRRTSNGESALKEVDVDFLKACGRMIFDEEVIGREEIREVVEDAGYEITGDGEVVIMDANIEEESAEEQRMTDMEVGRQKRTVQITVDGIFCINCINKLNNHLENLQNSGGVVLFTPFTLACHSASITYKPHQPLTIRALLFQLSSLDPAFDSHLVKPLSPGDRGREILSRDRRILVAHFLVALIFAIPTFVIAIVGMVILPSSNGFAAYWMEPIWGQASRGTVALWPLATVVQFGVGKLFYKRAWRHMKPQFKAILTLFQRNKTQSSSSKITWRSFFSFGTMDLLVVLSTSVSYFASLAMLILDVTARRGLQSNGTFFDSSVFLIMFILGGRALEAMAKHKTTSAIAALGSLKPSTALLLSSQGETDASAAMEIDQKNMAHATVNQTQEILTDLLDIDDLILLRPGDLPPADGIVHSGISSFDESSLTGESRPVLKKKGESILSGTTNLSSPIVMRITTLGQQTMVERIIRAVAEASGKKAAIEKLAETIVGVFVPVIVYLAILVTVVWLSLTLSERIPADFLSSGQSSTGDRVFFAFEFAIAVLVVACPCGIALAAPCAQAVGMGMAAKFGILALGGGQAFQAASQITDVVFDKTGTLTEGVHAVTWKCLLEDNANTLDLESATILQIVRDVESRSTHPLAKAVVEAIEQASSSAEPFSVIHEEERAGRGVCVTVSSSTSRFELRIGNYRFMEEGGYKGTDALTLAKATKQAENGCSLVYLCGRRTLPSQQSPTVLLGCFAISDRIREESKEVVSTFQSLGYRTYMLTGDNRSAAMVAAQELGIPDDNIVASVLPEDKGAFITNLQAGNVRQSSPKGGRRTVLFVGDGLNDSVALASADVAVALSHGSQAALASADFVLLNSSLRSVLRVVTISRKVYRRQKFNFGWAIVFNALCIPLAAGAFYDLHHIRLSPVWSAVAMALSSTSVVVSSLAMRWGL